MWHSLSYNIQVASERVTDVYSRQADNFFAFDCKASDVELRLQMICNASVPPVMFITSDMFLLRSFKNLDGQRLLYRCSTRSFFMSCDTFQPPIYILEVYRFRWMELANVYSYSAYSVGGVDMIWLVSMAHISHLWLVKISPFIYLRIHSV